MLMTTIFTVITNDVAPLSIRGKIATNQQSSSDIGKSEPLTITRLKRNRYLMIPAINSELS